MEERLPRLTKLFNNLIKDGRITEDAWRSIDRELEFALGRSATGRLYPMLPNHKVSRDHSGRFIFGTPKYGLGRGYKFK